jgi:HAD superfamily hydrolase (TIGR01509 family)
MLKGVIFDLDGTLAATEGFQWEGWAEVLKPYGISLSMEQYTKYAGKRGDIIESEMIRDFNLPLDKGSLRAPKQKLVSEWLEKREIKLMPHASEAVYFFIRKDIKVAVASGGPKEEVLMKLKKLKIFSLFPVIVGGDEVPKGKPNPDIYLLTLERLGLKSGDCIAFEDTEYGMKSAKAAGLTCLVVPSEFSRKQDYSKADGTFDNLREAVNWVKGRYVL